MNPIPIFLKFEDADQAFPALYSQVPTELDDEGNVTEYEIVPKYKNIYIPPEGKLYDDTDPENIEVIPGYHVNVLALDGEDIEPILPYSIIPEQPRIIWSL
jgi:hypothetical protein